MKGFAVTLTLGIIASMFSALLVTRTAFRWLIEKFGLKKLSMLDLIPKRKFDFLGKRRIAAILSLALIGGSIIIFAIRGEKNFGIDFRGGDLLVVDSKQPVTVAEARQALEGIGLGDVVIQFEREGMQDRLSFAARREHPPPSFPSSRRPFAIADVSSVAQENVGPQIGLEFAKRAALALGLGMIGILIYVTLRFEFSFALGAVVALLHDVIITLGVFSLIGGELSLVMVGAILTIAGYSINDTIVVFDRIREGLKHGERGSIQSLMNTSINETFGRTHPHRRHNPALRRRPFISSAARCFAIFPSPSSWESSSERIPRFTSPPRSFSGGPNSAARASGAKSWRPKRSTGRKRPNGQSRKEDAQPRPFDWSWAETLATTYSRASYTGTTIGAMAFHFRVRDGNGWGHHAKVTRRWKFEIPNLQMPGDPHCHISRERDRSLTTAYMGKPASSTILNLHEADRRIKKPNEH